jgi:23S rRNA pseudouridine1911/1915/1917 synthase
MYVPAHCEELSRTLLRKIVDLGGVHVGGRRVRRCSHPVKIGEKVEVYLDGQSLIPYELKETDVVFRDSYLLAVSKPAGVETQPTPARYKGTLYQALLSFLQDPFRPMQKPEIGMVQRLDRDTSGLMVFSIHPRAHRELTAIFTGRTVEKRYLALVAGVLLPSEGEFRSLLAREHRSNLMKSVERGGKEAITRYRVLETFSGATLVEIEILTGRSHQIRVHFSEAGHPLLGDTRYGGPACLGEIPVHRQMLHAWKLEFLHPVEKRVLNFEAPFPADMEGLLSTLRGGGGAVIPASGKGPPIST